MANWLELFMFFTAPYFLSESALWRSFGEQSLYRILIGKTNACCCCFSVAVFRAGMPKYNPLLKRWFVILSPIGCRESAERKRGFVTH